jgi:glucokinase
MTAKSYIAVDLGGTNVRAALFDGADSAIHKRIKVPTEAAKGAGTVLDNICRAVQEVMPADRDSVGGVGIGVPGPCDPFRGIVLQAPNIPGWENFPVVRRLTNRLQIPVYLGNDANLAALGEWKFGAGQGTSDLVYLTISTGIGGGVVCGGRLLVGLHGLAAELGHVHIIPDGPPCACGGRGHLEAVSAGPAIARRARELLESGKTSPRLLELAGGQAGAITAEHVGIAAGEGDKLALAVFAEAGSYIGLAIADFLVTFNPGVVVLGGGVSQVGEILLGPVRQAAQKYAMNPGYLQDLVITVAKLGDDAGLFGAFALCLEPGPSAEAKPV